MDVCSKTLVASWERMLDEAMVPLGAMVVEWWWMLQEYTVEEMERIWESTEGTTVNIDS